MGYGHWMPERRAYSVVMTSHFSLRATPQVRRRFSLQRSWRSSACPVHLFDLSILLSAALLMRLASPDLARELSLPYPAYCSRPQRLLFGMCVSDKATWQATQQATRQVPWIKSSRHFKTPTTYVSSDDTKKPCTFLHSFCGSRRNSRSFWAGKSTQPFQHRMTQSQHSSHLMLHERSVKIQRSVCATILDSTYEKFVGWVVTKLNSKPPVTHVKTITIQGLWTTSERLNAGRNIRTESRIWAQVGAP